MYRVRDDKMVEIPDTSDPGWFRKPGWFREHLLKKDDS